jgi:hypothetical protein
VSTSILRGDSETKCQLAELIDDGLDDDDPFFLVKETCSFLPHGFCTLPYNYTWGFELVARYRKVIWSMDFK